ncbi:hypothetical protein EB26_00872 [Enterococcus cecorum]|nr:hypothetical protein EB26_00872 [Enterococcus cecorum]
MKMIDVLAKLARDEIKDGTELEVHDVIGRTLKYTFYGNLKTFLDERFDGMDRWFSINNSFLNFDVKLIPPKEKRYLVKFNMRGLKENEMYLNYQTETDYVQIADKKQNLSYKTHFKKSELKSIKLVREFLEDMEGKYVLLEVTNDENH